MPISHADYETAATHPEEPTGIKEGAPALPEAQTAGENISPAFNPWACSIAAAVEAVVELVKQTKDFQQRVTRQIPADGEILGAPFAAQARSEKSKSGVGGTTKEDVPLPEHVNQVKCGAELDDRPTNAPPGLPQIVPQGQTSPGERSGNAVFREWAGGGRDFANRIDKAQGGIGNRPQNVENMQSLLEQAVTLLESLAQQPALQGYETIRRRLDDVEQLLGQTGNTRG